MGCSGSPGRSSYTLTVLPVIAIVGPTASGKSRLAMALADAIDAELVNADALQVYRGLDLGTAKPSAADRAAVPHHLIDVMDPGERYSAGRFAAEARAILEAIQSRGRRPILVGGSGLYLRALLDGIGEIPEVEAAVASELDERLARDGLPALRADLERLDPVTAERLAPGDTQRTLRALGVVLSSGRPLADWIAQRPFGETEIEAVRVGLTLDRALLYDRIARRVDEMLAAGWLREIRSLLDSGLDPSLPAFQAIGYRQLASHLRGECTLEEAVESTVRATRRYARRQLTWFRRDPRIRWFEATDPELFDQVRGVVDR